MLLYMNNFIGTRLAPYYMKGAVHAYRERKTLPETLSSREGTDESQND